MTCLDDRRLTDLHFGGGTPDEREHAHGCVFCTARARALAVDLARIDTVLRATAPPRLVARPAPAWRWAPVVVAAVLALAVAVQRGRVAPVDDPDDVATLADELTDSLTADVAFDDGGSGASSTCTWGDPLLGVGCEQSAVLQIAWR
jgi:hypothetical protein